MIAPQSTLRIRTFRHKLLDVTAQEWLDRHCHLAKFEDPLRSCEVAEAIRLLGLKGRIARYARTDRNGVVRFLWALAAAPTRDLG